MEREHIALLRLVAEFGLEWQLGDPSPGFPLMLITDAHTTRLAASKEDTTALVKAGCLSVRLDLPESGPVVAYELTQEGIRQFVASYPGLKALHQSLATVG